MLGGRLAKAAPAGIVAKQNAMAAEKIACRRRLRIAEMYPIGVAPSSHRDEDDFATNPFGFDAAASGYILGIANRVGKKQEIWEQAPKKTLFLQNWVEEAIILHLPSITTRPNSLTKICQFRPHAIDIVKSSRGNS